MPAVNTGNQPRIITKLLAHLHHTLLLLHHAPVRSDIKIGRSPHNFRLLRKCPVTLIKKLPMLLRVGLEITLHRLKWRILTERLRTSPRVAELRHVQLGVGLAVEDVVAVVRG